MAESSSPSSLKDKIEEKFHDHDSSDSDSDSDDDRKPPPPASANAKANAMSYNSKVCRLFGRDQPVHKVLGAGKAADIFLWRNKRSSAIVLGAGTALWFFFEYLEYHLITLVCHLMIVALAVLFLWSNASIFIHKAPLQIPQVAIHEECVIQVVSTLRIEINRAFILLREIGNGRDLKKLLIASAGLWVISVVGSWFNFLTLFYICFLSLFTLPLVYEKYEDQVDALAEKAMIEFKKQYAVLDAKVLSQIPTAGFKKD